MDLQEALTIFVRRWPIVCGVFILALGVAAFLTVRGSRAYEATLRVAVSMGDEQQASTSADSPPFSYYRDYYLWLSSEYLADDLGQVIQSDAFGADVAHQIGEDPRELALPSVVRTKKTHRMLDITVQAPSRGRALQLGTAIADLIRNNGPTYLGELASSGGRVTVIDEPAVHPATTTGTQSADIGLRGLLGLFAGLFLAFVIDYVDSTLRTAGDVRRALGLPLLGDIPREPR